MASISLLQGLGTALGGVAPGYMAGQERARLWNRQDEQDAWAREQHDQVRQEHLDTKEMRGLLGQAYASAGEQRPGESAIAYKARLDKTVADTLKGSRRGDQALQFGLAGANARQEADVYGEQQWAKQAASALQTGNMDAITHSLQAHPSGAFGNLKEVRKVQEKTNHGQGYEAFEMVYKDGTTRSIPSDVAGEYITDPAKGTKALIDWQKNMTSDWRADQQLEITKLGYSRNPQKEIIDAAVTAAFNIGAREWMQSNPIKPNATSEEIQKYNNDMREAGNTAADNYRAGQVAAKSGMHKPEQMAFKAASDELRALIATTPLASPEAIRAAHKKVNDARAAMGLGPLPAGHVTGTGSMRTYVDGAGQPIDPEQGMKPGADPTGALRLKPGQNPSDLGLIPM